jgi:Holliday junction DNA helicase RuvA
VIVGVRGVLEASGPDWVHLQVGGVTLQIFVPASAIGGLGPTGGPVHLFTHLRIRDDQPVLYGFPTFSASELFLVLMGVSGVGPRHSLSLISSLGEAGLQQAIGAGDISALSSVTGVGRRTAGRLVLELKGKLEIEATGEVPGQVNDDADVIAALTALGYSTSEARRAVNELDKSPDLTLEDRIRQALQQFGGGG